MATRQMILELDDLDYEAIQAEIAHRRKCARAINPDLDIMLPDGESNLEGAVFAECCRSLVEYRDLADSNK